jgi:hypothetical protein
VPEIRPWYEFADRLEKTAINMFMVLELPTNEQSENYAVALLARTVSNFNGVMVLLNSKLIVEARTLMRCCWENAFYLAAVAKSGDKFVNEMVKGDQANRHALGERLFKRRLVGEDKALGDVLKVLKKNKIRKRTPRKSPRVAR